MADSLRAFERVSLDSSKYRFFIEEFLNAPCTHYWRGYGSAMFLEFGVLRERGFRRDGSKRNPEGEWTLHMGFDWRVEGKRLVWCGSGDDEAACEWAFKKLLGLKVEHCNYTGRLSEIDFEFANKLHILTLATSSENPEWSLTKHLISGSVSLCSRHGGLIFDSVADRDA